MPDSGHHPLLLSKREECGILPKNLFLTLGRTEATIFSKHFSPYIKAKKSTPQK